MTDEECFLCNASEDKQILKNDYGYARLTSYAVSEGHMLIVPYRHFSNYFDATQEEKIALWQLVDEGKAYIDQRYQPDGYNVGMNINEAGGQSIPHLHIHIIPRYTGDVEDPKGGIRCVIPEKQRY